MNLYILHIFLLVTILLFITYLFIYCCHYAKQTTKQNNYWHTINKKMEKNNELKKVVIENRTFY